MKAAEGLVKSSLSLIWAGWAHLVVIVINVIIIIMVIIIMVIKMVFILLCNARLDVVSLDPLAQPLHGTVAVEWIRPQGPDGQKL